MENFNESLLYTTIEAVTAILPFVLGGIVARISYGFLKKKGRCVSLGFALTVFLLIAADAGKHAAFLFSCLPVLAFCIWLDQKSGPLNSEGQGKDKE